MDVMKTVLVLNVRDDLNVRGIIVLKKVRNLKKMRRWCEKRRWDEMKGLLNWEENMIGMFLCNRWQVES